MHIARVTNHKLRFTLPASKTYNKAATHKIKALKQPEIKRFRGSVEVMTGRKIKGLAGN